MDVWDAEQIFEIFSKIVYCIEVEDGHGSGVLVHRSGIVATNKHVVERQDEVVLRDIDGDSRNASVISSCRDVDLAFVQIPDFSFAELSVDAESSLYSTDTNNDDSVKTGETIYAIGHPLGLDFSLTKGIVSSQKRVLNGQHFIQIDAPINPGNSGGPLYSKYGRLIGINTCGKDGAEGLNFAIPVNIVYTKLAELISKGALTNTLSYCKLCGNASNTSVFCEHCGYKINKKATSAQSGETSKSQHEESVQDKDLVRCKCCGRENMRSDKFCHHCGTRLRNQGE